MSPRVAAGDQDRRSGATRWTVNLELHPGQREIFDNPARFKIIAAGRRFGKTVLCVALCIITAASKPDANVMWVAPAHRQARMAMRLIKKALPRGSYTVNNTTQEIFLRTGGRIAFVSADRPDNLRGEGLDLVIVDEAAFIEKAAWTQAIRPTLSDRNGHALLISTFDGENWFYELWRDAQRSSRPDWASFKFATADNPYIPQSEIDAAREELDPDVFGQEYEANPLARVGSVFQLSWLEDAYERLFALDVTQPIGLCEAGLDWGFRVTALEIAEPTANGDIIWRDEHVYERIELNDRCEDIAKWCKAWRVQVVYADAAGASENQTLAKTFERLNCQTLVQPVPFNAYKTVGIDTRRFYLRKAREVMTDKVPMLRNDSKAYKYKEGSDMPEKGNDHTVDAATAFYASLGYVLGSELEVE